MKERVLEIIADQFNVNVDDLTENTDFVEDLNADSIELVELVMSLEDEFDVEVEDEALEKIKTIGDVLDYIEEQK